MTILYAEINEVLFSIHSDNDYDSSEAYGDVIELPADMPIS